MTRSIDTKIPWYIKYVFQFKEALTPFDATTKIEELGCLFTEAKQIAISSTSTAYGVRVVDDGTYVKLGNPHRYNCGPVKYGPTYHNVTVIYETKPASLSDIVSYHHKVAEMTPYTGSMALVQMEFSPDRLSLGDGFDSDPVPEIKPKSKVRLKPGKPKKVTLH